jgi:hypothetical protein
LGQKSPALFDRDGACRANTPAKLDGTFAVEFLLKLNGF